MYMTDKYRTFADLAEREIEGVDYAVCAIDRHSRVAIVAPHAGHIEPGTSELAAAIAGQDFSLYCFEGLKAGRPHRDLHITSSRFDEPQGRTLAQAAELVVGVHGRADKEDSNAVWLGGRDEALRDAIGHALQEAGFSVQTTGHRLPGKEPTNICNVGLKKAGVQLELPRTLRDQLVADALQLNAFASVVRSAIVNSSPYLVALDAV